MAVLSFGVYDTDEGPQRGAGVQRLVNWAGAVISIALIVGVAIWGYKLAVRDVTGIPVVRALEGPMRIAPEDPGGQFASHQGLAVNAVAADGEAAPPADRLVLAPQPLDLAEEDEAQAALLAEPRDALDIAEAVNAEGLANEVLVEDVDAPALEVEEADALSLAIAEELARNLPADPVLSPPPDEVEGGPSLSPRPAARPARRVTMATAAPAPITAAPMAAAAPKEVDPSSLPVGTNLVQLGAFDDAESARREWERLSSRFSAYLGGKARVIQTAESEGRTFYRLRAHGFADEADARRFCTALLAEQAACIPVQIR